MQGHVIMLLFVAFNIFAIKIEIDHVDFLNILLQEMYGYKIQHRFDNCNSFLKFGTNYTFQRFLKFIIKYYSIDQY